MNNMYDILARMNLLEGKGAKPDFLDIDKDGDRKEPMKKAAREVDESVDEASTGDYSAKKARAGKDIGKPGKTFAKIAKSAGERYGSKERGEKVAGAVLAKLRAKEDVNEADGQGQQPFPFDSNKIVQVLKQYPLPKSRTGRFDDPMKHHASSVRVALLNAFNEGPQEGLRVYRNASYGRLDPGYDGEGYQSLHSAMVLDAFEEINNFLKQHGIDIRSSDRKQAGLPAESAMSEADMDESALQAYLGKKKYGEEGMKALQKAGRDGASKEKMARIRAQHDKMDEADMGEGNDFTGARLAAIRAGKPTFRLGDKTYKVTGDTSDEKRMDEGFADFFDKKQMYRKIGADVEGRSDDYVVTFKDGTRKRYQEVDGRRRVTSLEPVDRNDAVDDSGEIMKRGRGRPKGTGRKMGARGQTRVAETELDEDYDKDEYDEEGEMAKSQARTIEDAAQELQDILDDDENLPEWVQKKITLALEYIDTARDYMKANPDEEVTGDEEIMAEKAVSKAQRAAAGIARAAQKGDIPKSELRGASKEMAKMPAGELKKFAKTKEKGLPEKVKETDKEEVEETTTAGSVATAPAAGKTKGIFGKGVYEGAIAESFKQKLGAVLNEGMNISTNQSEDNKSLTITATDEDADQLADMLKMAGLFSSGGYQKACPMCGRMHGVDECAEQVEEDYANSAEDTETMDTDYMVNDIAGGLNGPKLQVNPNNMADNPLAMRNLGSRGASGQVNLGRMAEGVKAEAENRLWELYQRYDAK